MQTSAASVRDYVLEIEVAGEAHYRKLAQESPAPLNQIFQRLADEEHEHHETLEYAFAEGDIPGVRVCRRGFWCECKVWNVGMKLRPGQSIFAKNIQPVGQPYST